jgi:hypothetical protein
MTSLKIYCIFPDKKRSAKMEKAGKQFSATHFACCKTKNTVLGMRAYKSPFSAYFAGFFTQLFPFCPCKKAGNKR